MNGFISTLSISALWLITLSKSQSLQRNQQVQKVRIEFTKRSFKDLIIFPFQYKYGRDRDRYGNVQDFSVIEDSFYRPRRGDIILEDAPYDYEAGGSYYQKAPKSQVSVASSHGRPHGPEYPHKSRPLLLGMFVLKTETLKIIELVFSYYWFHYLVLEV